LLRPTENPPSLDTEGLFQLGNAYHWAGKAELAGSAREEFAAASEKDRQQAENQVQSKHLYEQANELARQNKFTEALALLQEALDKDPKNGFAYSPQAKIFLSMHETGKAKEPDFLYVEGVIAENEGQDEEALTAFERVTQINPQEADAYFEMGRIFAKRKDRAPALAAFRRASQLEPNDPDYKRALAEASSGLRDRDSLFDQNRVGTTQREKPLSAVFEFAQSAFPEAECGPGVGRIRSSTYSL
jgi:tetratricopeptide (TPR) repeat protein